MSFEGQIAVLDLAIDGLTGSKSIGTIRDTELVEADNITFEDNVIGREGGSAKYNATAITGNPSTIGGFDWWPDDVTQRRIIYTSAGELRKDSGTKTFPTVLKTGLTAGVVPVFVEGGKEGAAVNRKLFIVNGADAMQVLSGDGVTTANVTTPPVDWTGSNQPLTAVHHEGRIWAGGNLNDPGRMYYSTITDHEDFTGATSGTIAVYPGHGGRIIGSVSYKGLLIVFKTEGVFAIDTREVLETNWKVIQISGAVGMVSPCGFDLVDNDIIYQAGTSNLHRLSATTAFGDVEGGHFSRTSNISDFIRRNFRFDRLDQVRMIYYPDKRELHIAYSTANSTVNNKRLIVDFLTQTPRFRTSTKDVCESLWLSKDSDNILRLTSGDDNGFVWDLDQDARNKDGNAFTSLFRTPEISLAQQNPALLVRAKNGAFIELTHSQEGNHTVSVSVFWDGIFEAVYLFPMGKVGAGLGAFTLGTDALGGGSVVSSRKWITGTGRRISFEVSISSVDTKIGLSQIIFGFSPGGTD